MRSPLGACQIKESNRELKYGSGSQLSVLQWSSSSMPHKSDVPHLSAVCLQQLLFQQQLLLEKLNGMSTLIIRCQKYPDVLK
jgi:hypothetical protein